MPFDPQKMTAARIRRIFRPYGAAIGELAFHWNRLHNNLSKLFELVIKSASRRMGMAIWYSTDSDFAQRKMLRAGVEKAAQFSQSQRDDILWALNKIDESLRHFRNDALHAPLSFVLDHTGMKAGFIPDPTSVSPRAQSLWRIVLRGKELDLLTPIQQQAELASVLDRFIDDVCNSILGPAVYPWPDRPKLPPAHRTKRRRGWSGRSTAKRLPRQTGSSKA